MEEGVILAESQGGRMAKIEHRPTFRWDEAPHRWCNWCLAGIGGRDEPEATMHISIPLSGEQDTWSGGIQLCILCLGRFKEQVANIPLPGIICPRHRSWGWAWQDDSACPECNREDEELHLDLEGLRPEATETRRE